MDKREEIVEMIARALDAAMYLGTSYGPPPAVDHEHGEAGRAWDRKKLRRWSRAALSALEQRGYAIVPVEPTGEMLKAGMLEDGVDLASEYRAMLSSFRGGE